MGSFSNILLKLLDKTAAPQKTYVPWGAAVFMRSFSKINKQKGNNFISNKANFSLGLYIVYIYYSIRAYNKLFGIFIYNFTCFTSLCRNYIY